MSAGTSAGTSAGMGAGMGTAVRVSRDGAVGLIELDGPDRLNAIGASTYAAVAAAVTELRDARAIVVCGVGRGFSAGADIAEMRAFTPAQFGAFVRGFTDALDVVEASGVPVVAAIHGVALGGGLELALACHLRVCTPDARLGLPEVKLGVLPGAGGTQRLPRLLPRAVALEMLLFGDPIGGQRAYDLGLVNAVADDPLATARQLAERLAAGPPRAHAAAISLVRRAVDVAAERAAVVELFGSPDGVEGLAAFAGKRPAVFTGRA